jgi:hypothetical protein
MFREVEESDEESDTEETETETDRDSDAIGGANGYGTTSIA